jgi:hypothetical protein
MPTPADLALEQFREVEQLARGGRLLPLEVSLQLSGIFRRFLGDVYACSPFTKTTAELASDLPEGPYRQEVLLFLQDCDVMKFGPDSGSSKEAHELLQRAMELVQKLKTEGREGALDGTG